MTNAHVVDGARRIRVVLPIPSVDSPFDVAAVVMQIERQGKLHYLVFEME